MIAKLWLQQILLGRKTYSQVPRQLREPVELLLIQCGRADLTEE